MPSRSRTPSPATETSRTFCLSPAPNEGHLPTLSRPILVSDNQTAQQRSTSKNRNRSTSRTRKHQNDGIGGNLVGNMKRGIQIDDGSGKTTRLGVLLIIALMLFTVLTTVWVLRLNTHAQSVGGWSRIVGKWQKAFGDQVGPVMKKWSERDVEL
ncbi:hypothetical protein AYX14_06142 [Cryptococcus neoformans]|nr:hypothetical protein AYX15_06269 [Cryptococcus neoformans var. grubii]OWZ65721.1 hypothetical protein AYX14_06142 [Cryptococcus neoformans var. grubii]OXM76469.1 hypothetical protein C364_05925 [Cryptococcus neoformans var. grubii Bt63]